MKYSIKKLLKTLGLYNFICRTFLPKRKFIIEPFVYLGESDEIVKGEITARVQWLEKFEISTYCIEFAELEFWKEARKKYEFYDAIWIF